VNGIKGHVNVRETLNLKTYFFELGSRC